MTDTPRESEPETLVARLLRDGQRQVGRWLSLRAGAGRSAPVRRREPNLCDLEQRLVFSATPIPVPADAAETCEVCTVETPADTAGPEAQAAVTEVVIIDPSAPDYELLLQDISANAEQPFDVLVLDSTRDGVEQVTEFLAGRSEIDAIHLISHGSAGNVQLGSAWLNLDSLAGYAPQLGAWGDSLSGDGDILIYGCDLAANEAGRELVNGLSILTSADVAASDDLTGAAELGGDWDLEYDAGQVETGVAFSAQLQSTWLNVLTVTSFQEGDANGYSGTQDTFLREDQATTPQGSDSSVAVDATPGTQRQGLLRFDGLFGPGANQIPVGATINSVQLVLDVDRVDTPMTVSLHPLLANWSEADTWDSLGSGVQLDDAEAGSAADAVRTVSTTGLLTLDSATNAGLRATVQAWSDGIATNLGWVLTSDTADTLDFYSSEGGGARPRLVVDYSAGPIAIPNAIPSAVDDAWSTKAGQTLSVSSPGLLANDTDADLDVLNSFVVSGPANGILSLAPLGLTSEQNVTSHAASDSRPVWSPDGSRLAFVSDRSGSPELFLMNADGSAVQQLTTDAAEVRRVDWSPDGLSLTFQSNRDGDFEIYRIDADGSNLMRLTTSALNDASPVWSPDGSRILFHSQRDGNAELYVMDADGGNQTRLTFNAASDRNGSWSPDGSQIVFHSDRDGNDEIYVMDADGTNQTRLTNDAGRDRGPVFSPDGSRIVFHSNRDGDQEIFVMNADGSGVRQLTDNDSVDKNPDWSPDGTRVIFESDRGGDFDLYIASLTFDGGFDYTPAAGFTGVDSFTYAATDGVAQSSPATATITVEPATDARLWLTTKGAGSAPGTTWTGAEVLQFGNSGDQFDPDTETTSGTLEVLPGFVAPYNVRAMHRVQSDITLGTTGPQVSLSPGDLIVTLDPGKGVTGNAGGVPVQRDDVLVFRPDTPGDYSAGTWSMLIDGRVFDDVKNYNIHGLSLVEKPTLVGDTLLPRGTFLVAHSDKSMHQNVYTFAIAGAGPQGASQITEVRELLQGASLGLLPEAANGGDPWQIQGLHLVQQDTQFGATTVGAGTLLVQVNGSDTYGGQPQDAFDVVALSVTQTQQDAVPGTAGTADMLFDGSEVGLDSPTEAINGLTLVPTTGISSPTNTAPTDMAISNTVLADGIDSSGGVSVGTFTTTDVDDSAFSYSIIGGVDRAVFSIGGAGADELIIDDGVLDAGTQATYFVYVRATDSAQNQWVEQFAVTVGANQQPTATNMSQTRTYTVGTPSVWIGNIVISDADAGEVVTATLTLDDTSTGSLSTGTFGSLTSTYSAVTGVWQATGSVNDVNAALADVAFLAQPANTTPTSIITHVEDSFGTGPADQIMTLTPSVNTPISPVVDLDPAADEVAENSAVGTTVGIDVFAWDLDGDAVTYSLDDDAGGRFAITPTTGIVTVAGALDYEMASTRSITIRASSADGTWSTRTESISILDVNESSVGVVTDADGASNRVSENAAVGTAVGLTGTAVDGDATDTVTYSLTNDDGGRFSIDSASGVVRVASVIDREADGASRTVRVRATSSDGSSSEQDFTIAIDDVDEFAVSGVTDANGAANGVAENAAVGTPVRVTASATDADATDTVSYSLVDDDGGRFSIDSSSGVIRVATVLDRETDGPGRTVRVRATSTDGSTSESDFSIAIGDVDEADVGAVTDSNAAADSVLENSPIGTVVGITAMATDADATDTVSYSLTDDAGGRFAIDGSTGVVTVADPDGLDYESAVSHDITVLASSSDGSTQTAVFSVLLRDDATERPVGPISDADISTNAVAENAVAGTAVGITLLAADPDSTDSVTYSLDDDAGGRFTVNASTGAVTLVAPLDRESAAASYDITARATSTDGSSTIRAFTIALEDVNEFDVTAVSDADPAANIVSESAANGTVVGVTGWATDGDATNNSVVYSLARSAHGRFAIDPVTGIVTVAKSGKLDYESSTEHTIKIRATSDDGSSRAKRFTISVTDDNTESAISPLTDADSAANSVAESAPAGTVVGLTLLATDADGSDVVSYSLDDDAGGRFAIDAGTGVVTVAGTLDAESATSHTITVRGTSTDGTSTTAEWTIAVTDADEFDVTLPVDATAAANVVAEDAAPGTFVFVTAAAVDSDLTDSVSYSLDDDAGGRFRIDGSSGEVTLAGGPGLDYETLGSHTLVVRATSTDGSTASQSFVVDVQDVNDTAPVVSGGQVFGVAEDAGNGTVLGDVLAWDADTVGTLESWKIQGGNDDGIFAIDSATGQLRVVNNAALNFEAAQTHTLQIRVSDGVNASAPQKVVIQVGDANEAPIAADVKFSIAENSAAGTEIGFVPAADPDSGANGQLVYSIASGNSDGAFTMDPATGRLFVLDGSRLDFESTPVRKLTVAVADGGGLVDTARVLVELTDQNESPVATALPGATVGEDDSVQYYDLLQGASDPDGDSLMVEDFRVVSGDGSGLSRSGNVLRLNPAAYSSLSAGASEVITVAWRVSDGHGGRVLRTSTITITGLNDAPTGRSDNYVLTTDGSLDVAADGVLANDSDVDSGSLSAVLVAGPVHGTVTFRADGSFTYTPVSGFFGIDTFAYRPTDGVAAGDPTAVRISVAGATPAPSTTEPAVEPSPEPPAEPAPKDAADASNDSGGSPTAPPLPGAVLPGAPSGQDGSSKAEGSGHDDDVAIPFMPLVQPGDDSPRSARTELPQALAEQLEAVRAGRITRGNSSDGEPGSMSQLTFSTSSHRAQLAVLTQRLDTALEDVGEGIREAVQTQEVIVQAASLGMGGLSVGYVLWLLRSGTLFASMLTSLPAWKMMDPLPILDILEGQDEDSESLQSLIDRGQATLSEAAAE